MTLFLFVTVREMSVLWCNLHTNACIMVTLYSNPSIYQTPCGNMPLWSTGVSQSMVTLSSTFAFQWPSLSYYIAPPLQLRQCIPLDMLVPSHWPDQFKLAL